MKRGDIYAMVGRGDFSTKPRPGLIVQSDAFNPVHASVTACPITTHLSGWALFRIPIASDSVTGLRANSEIEIDRLQAIWSINVRQHIGRVPDSVMADVDAALRGWLDLL